MLEVTLLGQFEVLHDGERLNIPTRNAQSLFAYLLLNAGQAHRRERLAGLLWPDSVEENARSNLRHELWRLRKALEKGGQSYFLVDNLTIAFDSESDYALDVHTFESADLDDGSADELIATLSVYQGELLPGFYDEWVVMERDRLHALFETGMARLLELLQAEGRWAEVQTWATRWIAFGQWPEPAYRALMSAYANSGDLSKAVLTYERFARGLQQDLGLKPSEQTLALFRRLQAGWKPEVQSPPPTAGRQPPVATLDRSIPTPAIPGRRRTNLPRPLTSFIGREKEIGQVERLLAIARLVTITGSGGVGKTRLAIEVARSLASQLGEGVRWVELATLFATGPSKLSNQSGRERPSEQEPVPPGTADEPSAPGEDLVARAVARALRVPESPDVPLLEELVEHLRDRELLLVLDNCEHLIAACAALVERLLGDCPQLAVLATSREPLGVPGEKAWYLPSLSLPESGPSFEFSRIGQSEAVRLFVERASDVLPGYQPAEMDAPAIAQICLQLDGIPLAIELAAARINLLAAGEIAARLDDRFNLLTAGRRTALPRHQTLRAAIEWSHDLLSPPEQILFRRLSVFAGSFTLEAAEAVCSGGGISRDEVLDLLGRLVDKSLLQVDLDLRDVELATRYRYPDTIGSLGRLKLDEAGEIGLMRDRHAAYYIQLVESTAPKLLLQDQALWYRLLQAESANIRAVVEWSVKSDQAEWALRVVGALLWFWWSHGSVREGLDLVHKTLTLPSVAQFNHLRARALNTSGFLHWVVGDLNTAKEAIEEALSILRNVNDEAGMGWSGLGWSLQFLGLVLTAEGRYDLADKALKEGLAIAQKLGDLTHSSFSLAFQGDIALQQGDRARAGQMYEESAELLGMLGNKLFKAYPLRRLGYLMLEDNKPAQAWHYFHESLRLNREGDDRRAVVACLTSMVALALHVDKPLLAAKLLGAVESRLESLSINLLFLDQVELGRMSSKLLNHLGGATFTAALNEGWELSDDEAYRLVEELFGDEDK